MFKNKKKQKKVKGAVKSFKDIETPILIFNQGTKKLPKSKLLKCQNLYPDHPVGAEHFDIKTVEMAQKLRNEMEAENRTKEKLISIT